jgi:glycosyltransferase involved in cell wall biosynthesis
MNVAIFASAFHPSLGGVEELVRQLAHAYTEMGVSAIVLTNRWPRSLPSHELYEGIPVYRLPMRIPEGSARSRAAYALSHAAIRREMLRILRQHRIELVHIQCISSNGHYALAACRELGLPLVATTQGERTMDAGRIYERSAFINRVLRDVLETASFITACSSDTLADVERFSGKPFGDRARTVYNGIRLDEFASGGVYSHPRPYVLGIGRMVPQKGFDVLIEAFARADLRDCDLLLAGDGDSRADLERLASQTGAADRIRFVGRADRPMAVSLFKGCDIFVLPSRMEPQGIVNLEAMAAGKPVIASRVGGVPEIVLEDETGLLVPAGDVNALADALKRLAPDRELRARMGAAGERRAQEFSWPAIADQYVQIYRRVAPGKFDTAKAAGHGAGAR